MIGFIGLGNMASAMIGGMLQDRRNSKKNSRPFWNRNHHG